MAVHPPNPPRFGKLVRARRQELGLSLAGVRDAGGPVPTTVSQIERALSPALTASTFAKLDTALGWEPGSAARAWRGGQPLPTRARAVVGPASDTSVPEEALPHLTRILNRLAAAQDGASDELRNAIAELSTLVDRLNRWWLIRYIEDHIAATGDADDPILIHVIGPQIDSPAMQLQTDEDRQDAIYLRWLMGRGAEMSDDDRRAAELRWRDRKETL